MMKDDDDTIDDDVDSKEILQEMYDNGPDAELTRLTEMVRRHYLNYLEKQLQENLLSWGKKDNGLQMGDYDEMCRRSIKKTAELLEDKAVKACMIAKFYQRAMVKIIAIVRRTTEEKRLLAQLEKCIKTPEVHNPLTCSKETQTSSELKEVSNSIGNLSYNEPLVSHPPNDNKDNQVITLDEKIEMFKKHLRKEKCIDHFSSKKERTKTYFKYKTDYKFHRKHSSHSDKLQATLNRETYFSPTTSVVSTISPATKNLTVESNLIETESSHQKENENSYDRVDLDLARLFGEEKTDIEEIFGFDPNEELEYSQACGTMNETEPPNAIDVISSSHTAVENNSDHLRSERLPEQQSAQNIDLFRPIDLSKSIWPCELFMQKRKLSESLARLIEEDLRWHEVMKWKFSELFGDDSDDEFSACSPSIELNEILIGSCIRRISPWVVHYLMNPMRDGLIGNRFLFKKLAKNLAHSIIMENQYPDESTIKEYVENYFCLHQAVMSLEDIDESIMNFL